MVEEICRNFFRIGIPLPNNPLRELNSYLLLGEESDLLIDTGFRWDVCRKAIEDALDELHARDRKRDVLLTHLHSDHSGMADILVSKGRHIYMNEADVFQYNGVFYGDFLQKRQNRLLEEGFPAEELRIVEEGNPAARMELPDLSRFLSPIRENDVLRAGEYELQAISVPGHTPGNTMFWLEKQGIMICGDHILFDITPNITDWPGTEDALGNYLASLRKADMFPVRLALPGHRETGDYHKRIAGLILHHEKRLREMECIIREHPGCTAYQIAGMMHWKIRTDNWNTFPVVQKWFAVGECLSHLDHLKGQQKIIRTPSDGLWRYYCNESDSDLR